MPPRHVTIACEFASFGAAALAVRRVARETEATMRVAVIINPAAGALKRRQTDVSSRVSLAERLIAARGADASVLLTTGRDDAFGKAREEIERGAALVVAWGGDGTINEVGRAMAGSGIPLGIVPAGSGNGLARSLGLPLEAASALVCALEGCNSAIDAGEIAGRAFFNVAGVGLDAHVAWVFDQAAAHGRGLGGYVRVTAQALWSYEAAEYQIEADGTQVGQRAVIIAFANGSQYGNGAEIAPGASPSDGWLDMVVVGPANPLVNAWRARRLFDGSLERDPRVRRQRVREVTLTSVQPMRFHVDGEPCEPRSPLAIRVHPGVLTVRVRDRGRP
jgi:YegS/Rv2252/BmrU family lipid kinase